MNQNTNLHHLFFQQNTYTCSDNNRLVPDNFHLMIRAIDSASDAAIFSFQNIQTRLQAIICTESGWSQFQRPLFIQTLNIIPARKSSSCEFQNSQIVIFKLFLICIFKNTGTKRPIEKSQLSTFHYDPLLNHANAPLQLIGPHTLPEQMYCIHHVKFAIIEKKDTHTANKLVFQLQTLIQRNTYDCNFIKISFRARYKGFNVHQKTMMLCCSYNYSRLQQLTVLYFVL